MVPRSVTGVHPEVAKTLRWLRNSWKIFTGINDESFRVTLYCMTSMGCILRSWRAAQAGAVRQSMEIYNGFASYFKSSFKPWPKTILKVAYVGRG